MWRQRKGKRGPSFMELLKGRESHTGLAGGRSTKVLKEGHIYGMRHHLLKGHGTAFESGTHPPNVLALSRLKSACPGSVPHSQERNGGGTGEK